MPPKIALTATAFLLTLCSVGADQADAQLRSRQSLQRPGRMFGIGGGTGYHWRNPGTDSGYYNPYSATNSYLVSQQGDGGMAGNGGMQGYGSDAYRSSQPGVPYSVYAPTAGVMPPNGYGMQGQTLTPSFELSDQDDKDEEEKGDSEADRSNDFKAADDADSGEPGSLPLDAEDDSDEDAEFEDADADFEDIRDDVGDDVSETAASRGSRAVSQAVPPSEFSSFLVQ